MPKHLIVATLLAVAALTVEATAGACTEDLECALGDVLAPHCATTGPKVGTCVGCDVDAECGPGKSCNVDLGLCLCVCVGAQCSGCDGGVGAVRADGSAPVDGGADAGNAARGVDADTDSHDSAGSLALDASIETEADGAPLTHEGGGEPLSDAGSPRAASPDASTPNATDSGRPSRPAGAPPKADAGERARSADGGPGSDSNDVTQMSVLSAGSLDASGGDTIRGGACAVGNETSGAGWTGLLIGLSVVAARRLRHRRS